MLLRTKVITLLGKRAKMAFLQWRKCLTEPKQALKLTLVILIFCMAMYQLSECLRKIVRPPVSTHYSFHLNETLNYPALTICRIPAYKASMYGKYGLTFGDPRHPTAWQNFKFDNYTTQQFFEEATYSFSELLPLYGFDGFNDNVTIKSTFLLTEGRCFTLIPNKDARWTSNGYFLYMQHTDTIRKVSAHGVSTSGFNVYVHDRREIYTGITDNSDSLMDHIYTEAGEEMRVNLKLQVYTQLPTNNYKCNDSHLYSQTECQHRCIAKHITELVGCSAPWLPNQKLPPCHDYNSTYKLIKQYTSTYYHHLTLCPCLRSCSLRVYTPHIRSRRDLDLPNSQLAISFSCNLITVMKEILGYDWNLFLSDLGGSLGFLLGLSVLGLIGTIEQMCKTFLTKKNEIQSSKINNNATTETKQKVDNTELEFYLNDRKLIDQDVAKLEKNNCLEFRSDSNFYASQNHKDNFIQKKY